MAAAPVSCGRRASAGDVLFGRTGVATGVDSGVALSSDKLDVWTTVDSAKVPAPEAVEVDISKQKDQDGS